MDKKQIPLLLGLLGVAAGVLVYMLYFKPTMENVARLKAEDAQLQARIAELEALRDQRDFFIEETEKMGEKVEEIYAELPENVTPEDAIREAIDIQDKAMGNNLQIAYAEPVSIYTPIGTKLEDMGGSAVLNEVEGGDAAAAETADADAAETDPDAAPAPAPTGEEGSPTGYDLMQEEVSYVFESDLNQFLTAAAAVCDREERDVIKQVSMAYDETEGLLTTQMDVNKFYVTGRNLDYTPATFSVPTGSQLFSTYRISESPAEGGESADGGAAAPE